MLKKSLITTKATPVIRHNAYVLDSEGRITGEVVPCKHIWKQHQILREKPPEMLQRGWDRLSIQRRSYQFGLSHCPIMPLVFLPYTDALDFYEYIQANPDFLVKVELALPLEIMASCRHCHNTTTFEYTDKSSLVDYCVHCGRYLWKERQPLFQTQS